VSFTIDESTEFGARAARHLREDTVAWLTTVTPSGAPVPSVVWFWWDEPDTVIVFSQTGTARTRNLAANPRVSLNFPGDGKGGDIVVLSARATMDDAVGPVTRVPGYVEKYESGFQRLGLTPEQFAERYPVSLRIELTRLRGH
jgi:PPOX class probable F420-dependent enzyme